MIERGRDDQRNNGGGVVFDYTNLHAGANVQHEARVALWLDVERYSSLPSSLYNRALLKAIDPGADY